MKKCLALVAIGLLAAPAMAHDMWVQPERFVLEAPAAVPVSLFVGHGQDRNRWGVPTLHITAFETHGPDGIADQTGKLALGTGDADATIRLTGRGAHLIVVASRHSSSVLPAGQFDDYVAKEGITPIAERRARANDPAAEGREIYSRRAKSLVQIGAIDRESIDRVTKPTGLRLEITPDVHPGTVRPGGSLPVEVRYKGAPLPGALVKLNDLVADEEPVATQRTGADGRAVFRVPAAGEYQLNVIWAEPLEGNDNADYDTTFSSFTFATGI